MDKHSKKTLKKTTKVLTRNQKKNLLSKHASNEVNAIDHHIEPPIEDNPQLHVNNVAQNEMNSENMATQTNEIQEDAMDIDKTIEDVDGNPSMKKKTRGPTKVKRLPSDLMSRIEVQFNAVGEPIGDGSVKLSSYLGPLVREHVPFSIEDWRLVSDKLKVVLWESVQARFKLDEEWQKVPIFQQMGCIWRGSKSNLVKKIKEAKNMDERLKLKPDNFSSTNEWKRFVELKTSATFKKQSEKFKTIKAKQTPHTCSRRGMARLTEDLKEQSVDPSSVSRVQVWIKSRIRKNGEPVTMHAADTIEKIKKFQSESQSSSASNIKDDALSHVIGQDRPGRLRAMGRGMTLTKVVFSQVKEMQVAQYHKKVLELEQLVHGLMKNQNKHTQMGDNCDLLHWNGNDEIVAEGKIILSDPNELFNGVPLGPNAMKILILCPRKSDVFLWRPSPSLVYIGDAKDEIIAWPANKVVMRIIENFENDNMSKTNSSEIKCKLYDWGGSKELVAKGRVYSSDPNQVFNGVPLGPNAMIVWVDNPKKEDAFLWRPISGMSYIREVVGKKIAWPESKLVCEMVNSTSFCNMTNDATRMSTNFTPNTRCKLVDVHGTGKVVAEGTVSSSDPNALVHSIPLGNNAVRVWVDVVKVPSAQLWRSTSFLECILDALGSTVAWPIANIIVDPSSGN